MINSKFIFKIILGVVAILLGFFYYTNHVGKYDINIKYDRISNEFQKPSKISEKNQEEKSKKNLDKEKNISKNQKKEREKEIKKIKDTVKNIFNNAISNIENSHHSASTIEYNKELHKKICNIYNKICKISYIDNSFSTKKKIYYQAIIIYTITQLDKFIKDYKKIENTISLIHIKNNNQKRRGFAGNKTMTLSVKNISSYREFSEVFTHELGHIIDLGLIKGDHYKKSSEYTEFGKKVFSINDPSLNYYKLSWKSEDTKKKNSSFKDFVSGYALTNPFEDFSESLNFYLYHYKAFKEMAKNNYILSKKFKFLNNLFDNNYFKNGSKALKNIKNKHKRRPWDTTRIISK